MPILTIRGSKRGPRGEATIKKLAKKLVVTMEKTGETLEFPREDVEFDFPKANSYNVNISADKNKLYGVTPYSGTFFVKVKDFAHGEGQEPAPIHKEGMGTRDDGTAYHYAYDAFTVLLEISRGSWKGTLIPAFLRYKFMDAGDGDTAAISGWGKHTEHLQNFLELAGLDFDNDTIPLSENILPYLRDALIARGAEFQAVVREGWINAFAPIPDGA
jgi:hypothetical protein